LSEVRLDQVEDMELDKLIVRMKISGSGDDAMDFRVRCSVDIEFSVQFDLG
jgi:hypothetical protein